MVKFETTLLEDIEEGFVVISEKVERYQCKLEGSLSHFETDKHVESLIKSQRLLKTLSAQVNKSLDGLIDEYY
ncbi:MAG: hypothetical protein L3J83_07440 [Proteobacteria bacterium]|nr:hypothetical protein [Pseudomonadota bacterium]